MRQRPKNYAQWRACYQSELLGLGYCVFVHMKVVGHRSAKLTKILSRSRAVNRRLRRLERIRQRLDVEHEVQDESFCRAMLDAVRESR